MSAGGEIVEYFGSTFDEEHDSVGPMAGTGEKNKSALGENSKVGDVSTGAVLLGAYLNGPLSACKAPDTNEKITSLIHDESDKFSGEESSILIRTHAKLSSVPTDEACANVTLYTMGGGPHENAFCTSNDGPIVATEKDKRPKKFTPESTEKAGNTFERDTHNIPNTGIGSATVADVENVDKVAETSNVNGE